MQVCPSTVPALCFLWICWCSEGLRSLYLLPSLKPWEHKHHITSKFLQIYIGTLKWLKQVHEFSWLKFVRGGKKRISRDFLFSLSTLALFLCVFFVSWGANRWAASFFITFLRKLWSRLHDCLVVQIATFNILNDLHTLPSPVAPWCSVTETVQYVLVSGIVSKQKNKIDLITTTVCFNHDFPPTHLSQLCWEYSSWHLWQHDWLFTEVWKVSCLSLNLCTKVESDTYIISWCFWIHVT